MLDNMLNAMPPCFEKYCSEFNNNFRRDSQQENFRIYLAGLLSECHRKNIASIATSTIGCSYVNLHHFLHNSPWEADAVNDQRIEIIWRNRQTRPKVGFSLIMMTLDIARAA